MKIAFITSVFPKLSETFILNQITGLIDRGHSVEIFANRAPDEDLVHRDVEKYNLLDRVHYIKIPVGGAARYKNLPALLRRTTISHSSMLLNSLNVFKYKRQALSLYMFYRAAYFCGDFDIFHCHFGQNGNLGASLKELGAKAALVTTFHGCDIRLGQDKGGEIYRKLFRYGDCFLSISDYNYDNLVNFGLDPEKITYLPVGINMDRFSGCTPGKVPEGDSPIKIVTVGRLVEEKGLRHGIQAVKKVLTQFPDREIEYLIAGEGPLKNELKELAERLGLTKNIQFLGPLCQEEVVNLLNQGHIFFLPSIAEALPVCLMEAQAAFLPVVATDVGSVRQLVLDDRTGFIAEPENADDMALKMGLLLDMPERWAQMGEAGRQHIADNYDIDKLNDRLVQIYRKLCSTNQ
ncbi:MAG TPA: colanic acid biosynthesis glycosyltransferase WcaL [Thermodesulfobacteriaceae bacterium]|nr:colanic acid biosynthesis glycosyltransferase WcaL [Thermodesulfobacteriaceae bacterium]